MDLTLYRHDGPAPRDPVMTYLARLSPGSRETMARALRLLAVALGEDDPRNVEWARLGYSETRAIAAALEKTYAPRTVNRILSALRGVLEEAWVLGLVTAEQYHKARRVKGVSSQDLPSGRELTTAELRRLYEAAGDDTRGRRDRAVLALLYGAGLRRAEARSITRSMLEPEDEAVRVVGKGRKERRVYFLGDTFPDIFAWLERHGDRFVLTPVNKAGRVLSGPISIQGIHAAVQALRKAAGVRPFTAHDLRRTYASRLLDSGADLPVVQRLLGHASPVTTANAYDKRGDRAAKAAAQKVTLRNDT